MASKAIRLLIHVIVLCLIFTSVCYAETSTIDITRLSDDEITDLSTQIQQEMVTRGMTKTASLQTGRYTGGKDIPAGAYILRCKTDADHHGIVWVSAANDDLDNDYPSKLYEHVSFDKEETFYIKIEEGGILNVPFPVELEISTGIMFK